MHLVILVHLQSGQKVLIAAHGNSLRALVKYLDNVSDGDITELNIPTGNARFFLSNYGFVLVDTNFR